MSALLPVYARSDLKFDKGEGAYLYTDNGKKYLDFAAGIAVNALGHSHPHLVSELQDQVGKLWHVSNMYKIHGMERLAQTIADNSFASYTFFCNSGVEAVECGLKMIRKYHDETGNPEKFRVISFEGCFHGRSLAGISAGKKDKLMKGFEPAAEGFDQVPFEDIEAVKNAITPETGGIIIEPIIGEGGIKVASKKFMQELRALCDEKGILLFLDEIQCGMGRTGTFFAYELSDIEPDILASAKGIGNGFPLGACLFNEKVGSVLPTGCHGSTYGGNPLAMRVGNAVMDIMLADGFLDNVKEIGAYLVEELEKLIEQYPDQIDSVRGEGLMIGLRFKSDGKEYTQKFREVGLLTAPAADNIVRILPPLIITKEHVDEAISKIKEAL